MTQSGSKFANKLVVPLVFSAALTAMPAQADYPGALWSVDEIRISFDGAAGLALDQKALRGKVQAALRQANDTYFFGDRPVSMQVTVLGPDAMIVSVVDRSSGAVLTKTGRLSFGADITATALAWMDGLECAGADCSVGAPATAMAAAPQPAAVTARPASPQPSVTSQTGQATLASTVVAKGIPIPRPRPGTRTGTAIDLASLDSLSLAKTPSLENTAPIRISRFNTKGLGDISYAPSDRMVLAEPRTAAAAAVPRRTAVERTLFGRLFTGLARFLGITDTQEEDATQLALAPAQSAPDTSRASASANPTQPFQPSERWRLTQPPAATTSGERVAALGPTLPAPASTGTITQTQQEAQFTGLRLVPSPGLSLPAPRTERGGAVVTPIRVAAVRPTASEGQADTANLSVRLSPELFGKYSAKAFDHLFGSYGNQNAKVTLVADDSASGGSVDRVLAARGLGLDSDRYAKAERVYWGGETGSRGFWISMPRVPPSAFVLVASAKASVIANVQASGNGVRVSDAVAEALGMSPGSWSDVQVIALKQLNRTAQRSRTRTALQ